MLKSIGSDKGQKISSFQIKKNLFSTQSMKRPVATNFDISRFNFWICLEYSYHGEWKYDRDVLQVFIFE